LSEVQCGPVQAGSGGTRPLIADPTAAGIVGCNVFDEYVKIPADQKAGPFSEKELSNGWICGTDDEITVEPESRCARFPHGPRFPIGGGGAERDEPFTLLGESGKPEGKASWSPGQSLP